MQNRRVPGTLRSQSAVTLLLLCAVAAAWTRTRASQPTHQQLVPRVWDEEALKEFELPAANADFRVRHVTPEYYYSLPERRVLKSYPMYAPDAEPRGYLDSLRTLEPVSILDTDTIDTEAEWLRAGEVIFDSPALLLGTDGPFSAAGLVRGGVSVAADRTIPFHRYVVVAKGDVRLGAGACSNCHQRVMADGSVLKGVQGNYPLDRLVSLGALALRNQPPRRRGGTQPIGAEEFLKLRTREQFGAPWIDHPTQTLVDTMSFEGLVAMYSAIPPGVLLRQGSNLMYPTKVPDLRGVRNERFLDATGLVQQRSIADLMRYASLTQSIDLLNHYGDWVPVLGNRPGPLPAPDSVRSIVAGRFDRFSDAQLFALARYLYSLEPLPSPHTYDAETLELGERVFIEQGCVTCHTPPNYTNNQLTPAAGFEPPEDHYDRYPIFDVSVETDPGLALYTRRATGYYKVPSLRGLWYRERLFHDGSLSLEQVLDPARLRDDFVPAGFKGVNGPHAVPGHPFGFELGDRERKALIAFLLTL